MVEMQCQNSIFTNLLHFFQQNSAFLSPTANCYVSNTNKYITKKRGIKLKVDDILRTIALIIFAVFAGTVRYINKEIHNISIKELLLNGLTALLSGMLIYLLTADIQMFIDKPLLHAGIVGLAGYMAPETLAILQYKWTQKLKGEQQ